jgi:hypothetical protein
MISIKIRLSDLADQHAGHQGRLADERAVCALVLRGKGKGLAEVRKDDEPQLGSQTRKHADRYACRSAGQTERTLTRGTR